MKGRQEIRDFLAQKWSRELDYALRKDLWAFTGNRIAVRFQYESLDESGQWWRSYREASVRATRRGRRLGDPTPLAARADCWVIESERAFRLLRVRVGQV